MAPSPTRIRSASSSLRSRLKKVTSLRTFFALARWREASSLWCFDSSLGVSSAGVGTWHEAFALPRRLPRLRRAHPCTQERLTRFAGALLQGYIEAVAGTLSGFTAAQRKGA